MKKKTAIILICAAFAAGFFAGRATINTDGETVYIKGETVRDSIEVEVFVPIKEYVPSEPEYIYKYDTIYINNEKVIVKEVDSAAIIRDYIVKRQYAFEVYDDEFGSMKIDSLNVQYNQLQGFYFTRTPVQKVITRHTEPKFVPFAITSYNTFKQVSIQGGVIYKKSIFSYRYIFDTKTTHRGHEVGIGVSL